MGQSTEELNSRDRRDPRQPGGGPRRPAGPGEPLGHRRAPQGRRARPRRLGRATASWAPRTARSAPPARPDVAVGSVRVPPAPSRARRRAPSARPRRPSRAARWPPAWSPSAPACWSPRCSRPPTPRPRAAQQVVDAAKEHGQPLVDEAKSVGQEVGEPPQGVRHRVGRPGQGAPRRTPRPPSRTRAAPRPRTSPARPATSSTRSTSGAVPALGEERHPGRHVRPRPGGRPRDRAVARLRHTLESLCEITDVPPASGTPGAGG